MSLEIKVHNSTGCLKNMDLLELQGLCCITTFPTTYHTLTIACTMDNPDSLSPASTFLLTDCWNSRSVTWKL